MHNIGVDCVDVIDCSVALKRLHNIVHFINIYKCWYSVYKCDFEGASHYTMRMFSYTVIYIFGPNAFYYQENTVFALDLCTGVPIGRILSAITGPADLRCHTPCCTSLPHQHKRLLF